MARSSNVESGTPETGTTRRKVKRKAVKIAVIFDMVEGKLAVREVFRDLAAFADRITDDPANVPLFAKIEVPFL